MHRTRRRLRRLATAAMFAVTVAMAYGSPAYAAPEPGPSGTDRLNTIINNATGWLTGILAGIATLFLTIGGVRYVMAGGDPGEIEKAKGAFKSAVLGYALAALAPIVVMIVKGILGIQ